MSDGGVPPVRLLLSEAVDRVGETIEEVIVKLLADVAPGRFIVYDLQEHLGCMPGGALPKWEPIAAALEAKDCGKAFLLRVWPSCPKPLIRYLPMLASLVKTIGGA